MLAEEAEAQFFLDRPEEMLHRPTSTAVLEENTNHRHLTNDALTSWRPPKATRGRKAKS